MQQYLLDEELGRALVLYLYARPYGEVKELIERLQALQPHECPEPDKDF